MIQVTCACGFSSGVRDDLAGKKLKCPACKQQVAVPAEAPLLLEDAPPAPPPPPPPPPAPVVAPEPEPAPWKSVDLSPVRILPWKKLAFAGFGAAALLFVVAVLAVATRP